MVDGVMAWFIDTAERERVEPAADIRCATTIAEEIGRYVTDNSLDIGIRIDLHAGDVALRDFGAEQRIAVTCDPVRRDRQHGGQIRTGEVT